MLIRFYGTRGSLPTPGPSTVRYGGNTSCVMVRSQSGTLVIIDAGTGAAVLGRELVAAGGKLRGHILIGHTHWDHIQGFPFFEPIFTGGRRVGRLCAARFSSTLCGISCGGQMQCTYFPVEFGQLPAAIRYHELIEGEFRVGDIRVTTRYLNHTALTLGYRLECDGASDRLFMRSRTAFAGVCRVVPSCRPVGTHDRAHAAFFDGADLLIHDAQYLASEYPGKVSWGHSTVEYAVAVARLAKVKRLGLTHHDPTRTDVAIDAIGERVRGQTDVSAALEIFAAAEGQEIRLVGTSVGSRRASPPSATSDIGPALAESTGDPAGHGDARQSEDAHRHPDVGLGAAVSTAAIDRRRDGCRPVSIPRLWCWRSSDAGRYRGAGGSPAAQRRGRYSGCARHRAGRCMGCWRRAASPTGLLEPVSTELCAGARSRRDPAPRLPLAAGKDAGRRGQQALRTEAAAGFSTPHRKNASTGSPAWRPLGSTCRSR